VRHRCDGEPKILRCYVFAWPAHELGAHLGSVWRLDVSECAACGRIWHRLVAQPPPPWRPSRRYDEDRDDVAALSAHREAYGARGVGREPSIDKVYPGSG